MSFWKLIAAYSKKKKKNTLRGQIAEYFNSNNYAVKD
jgi:hypothetical protein